MDDDTEDKYRFGIGAVVRVTGIAGPRMKVTKIDPPTEPGENAHVHCFWFDRDHIRRWDVFTARQLAKAKPWEDRPREPNAGASMAEQIEEAC